MGAVGVKGGPGRAKASFRTCNAGQQPEEGQHVSVLGEAHFWEGERRPVGG